MGEHSILPMCAVFSCFHTTDCEAYSLTGDGYGIFNVCILNVGTKGGQVQTSPHCKSGLRGTGKLTFTLPLQGIESKVFGFEFRLSDHWHFSRFQAMPITFSGKKVRLKVCIISLGKTVTRCVKSNKYGWAYAFD